LASSPAPAARPKKAPVVELDDEDDDRPIKKKKRRDDDDEDEDDRPRKKKKKPKKAGGGAYLPVILVAALVGLLVLGGAGYGIYALAFKKKDDTASGGGGPKAAVPAGWVEHKSDQDGFKAYFPKQPQVTPAPPPGGFKGVRPKSATGYIAGGQADDLSIILLVAQMQPNSTSADREEMAELFNKGWRGGANSQERTATWAGRPAKEFVIEKKNPKGPSSGILVRQMSTDTHVYGVAIFSKNGPPSAEVLNGFFDNFELLK